MALDSDLGDRVRQALGPDAPTVDRMVATALRRGRVAGRHRLSTWRVAVAAAAVLVCALWVVRQQAPRERPADLILTRAGEVVMFESRSGEIWILGPEAAPDPAKRGTGFVIVEGEPK